LRNWLPQLFRRSDRSALPDHLRPVTLPGDASNRTLPTLSEARRHESRPFNSCRLSLDHFDRRRFFLRISLMLARQKLFRAALLACALLARDVYQASAQTASPRSNDAEDQGRVEQLEQELSRVLAAAFQKIDQFAHPSTRQEAKDALVQGQQAWVTLRALDCQAESALMWLRSARTRVGYTASCVQTLTSERIGTLKHRYFLKD
jgi:uncharacterized protein YecT (DUF1311 family)